MANVSIARRYARALIEVAAESSKLDAIAEQLEALAKAMSQKDLADVLLNPAYTRAQRSAVVEGLVQSFGGKSEPAVANLLRLLVDRNRAAFLPDIARLYADMVDARMGRVRGHVTTSAALPAEALQRIEQALARITQRNVVLQARVDPSLLGGVSAQVGSVVYDGSLRSQLEEMRRALSSR